MFSTDGQDPMTAKALEAAIDDVTAHEGDAGDGKWLERIVAENGSDISEWDFAKVEDFESWSGQQEIGIDLVGTRADGELVAIQCKARRKGQNIRAKDIESFLSASDPKKWSERWVVSPNDPAPNAYRKTFADQDPERRVRWVNIRQALEGEVARRNARKIEDDPRTAMQSAAVETTVRKLEGLRGTCHPGWSEDESRGRVIMPCGTGKTRVGYEISRRLAANGLTIVLAPSIGLVRQLRQSWLDLAKAANDPLETLSVCSDSTVANPSELRNREESLAGSDETRIGNEDERDPTEDRGMVRAGELAGRVEKEHEGIRKWLRSPSRTGLRPVVFCTYQSSHHLARALRDTGSRAELLICDEAHRTAGIVKQKRKRRTEAVTRFTICHDGAEMPARTRVYMTATPRTFAVDETQTRQLQVNTMDDEAVFGAECFRLSYRDAVKDGHLCDYRIIAISLDREAHAEADRRALESGSAQTSLEVRKLGFGLAMSGAIPNPDGEGALPIRSAIAFCNRIARSDAMAAELSRKDTGDWLRARAKESSGERKHFKIEHLDASDRTTQREAALGELRRATENAPHALTNVGIFGEGIDTPDLDAVAFIEPRKSPVDVAQNVGRVMRLSAKKEVGYIVVPIEIPAGRQAEAWLESRNDTEGWKELGQVLNALRAHDGRIEDALGKMLHIVAPVPVSKADHLVSIRTTQGVRTFVWNGREGDVEHVVASTKDGKNAFERLERHGEVKPVDDVPILQERTAADYILDDRRPSATKIAPVSAESVWKTGEHGWSTKEPKALLERRLAEETAGSANARTKLRPAEPRKNKTKKQPRHEYAALRLVQAIEGQGTRASAIHATLLRNSGLMVGQERDANMLQRSVTAAADILRNDGLEGPLAAQLQMERLQQGNNAADACTVACVLIMTACIVQARLQEATSLRDAGIGDLKDIAGDSEPANTMLEVWNRILDVDFRPVFGVGRDILTHVTRRERKTAALDAALRRLAADAAEIAETYTSMGMDYAGELFNRVMGNQASDGAYFTRPAAAVLLAELALSCLGQVDWSSAETWDDASVFDPACGSGTLLLAWLHGMRRRAQAAGTSEVNLRKFQRRAVENGLAGLDINPVSLQLAGAQQILADIDAGYHQINLWQMPYGFRNGDNVRTPAGGGTLELLTDSRIVGKIDHSGLQELDLGYRDNTKGMRLRLRSDEPTAHTGMLDDVVEQVVGRRAALSNPPFVTREKLGQKFHSDEQEAVRKRIDGAQDILEQAQPEMVGLTPKKTTTRPLYVGLSLLCIDHERGILGTILPTVGLTGPTGIEERKLLGRRLHIRFVVTGHEHGNVNLSQRTSANESLIIGSREGRGQGLPTLFVSLQRMPRDAREARELAESLIAGEVPLDAIARQVSSERIEAGDWSAAGWADPGLDEAVLAMAKWPGLKRMGDFDDVTMHAPGEGALVQPAGRGKLRPVIYKKGGDGQRRLVARADTELVLREARDGTPGWEEAEDRLWRRWQENYAAHLLICTGQDLQSARVTAVASPAKYIGTTWKPVQGVDSKTAKAWAVWLNSSAGRIQMLKHRGGKRLSWPNWRQNGLSELLMPKPGNWNAINRLASAFDKTSDCDIDRFDAGWTLVRKEWDRAVGDAIDGADWNLLKMWAEMLNREPAVSPKAWRAHRIGQ